MIYNQIMINQINAIIYYLPEQDKQLLPYKLIRFFQHNANCLPEEAINTKLPIEKQDFDDETILMIYYINNLLQNKRQG